MALTHAKVSAKADGGDSSLVLPSDWNADHIFTGVSRLISADTIVPAYASYVVSYDFEIASGVELELAANATMEIL